MGTFFYISKRDDSSDPKHMELYPLSYKEREGFLFSFFKWLIASSYLHSPSRQMAQTGWGWIMQQAWKEEHKGVLSGSEDPAPGMMDGSAPKLYFLLTFRLILCSSAGYWTCFPLWKSPISLLLSSNIDTYTGQAFPQIHPCFQAFESPQSSFARYRPTLLSPRCAAAQLARLSQGTDRRRLEFNTTGCCTPPKHLTHDSLVGQGWKPWLHKPLSSSITRETNYNH